MEQTIGTVLVTIGDEDIDTGVPGSPCWCPVACALRRVLPPGDIRVHRQWVQVRYFETGATHAWRAELPTQLADWNLAFDRGVLAPVPPSTPLAFREVTAVLSAGQAPGRARAKH